MFSKEVVKKNVLFYEERTIHDSSLSYCAHAQACAAIGETELSWEFFKKCMVIDLDDNPNDTQGWYPRCFPWGNLELCDLWICRHQFF